jgi:hypothetical protein
MVSSVPCAAMNGPYKWLKSADDLNYLLLAILSGKDLIIHIFNNVIIS